MPDESPRGANRGSAATLDAEPALLEPGWDPHLARKLFNLLHWVDLGCGALETELERLERQYDTAVYAELIFLLSHLRFSGEVARRHWSNVLAHRKRMELKLEGPVDMRVAMVSYFVEVNRSFRSPKLIEMRVFEQTRASAYWDELTGLRNYRFFSEHLHQEVLRSKVTGAPMSLVMLDVDDFKSFNDGYGHEAGNQALAALAAVLPRELRETDVAARYGGEEFALVLNSTPKHEALTVAERVRAAVERQAPQRDDRRLTVSLGVATYPADACDAGELVRHADRALYEAKFGGKNQVRLFGESTRSFVRFDAALSGSFTTQSLERHTLTTVRVSQGGLQFATPLHVVEKSVLEIAVELPNEPPLTAVGRVIRVALRASGGFDIAVQFLEMSPADRARLTAHLAESGTPVGGDASQRGDGGIRH